jgi:arylsulfatase
MKVMSPKIAAALAALFLTAAALLVCLPPGADAAQFDAPFYTVQKRDAVKWAAEDKTINAKLAALKKKFGKTPNIIYILTDDVGWGELGWQGGGKHRGTPTPELDKMAFGGMRFWTAYSEPSCTPSRIAINTGRHPVRTGLLSVLWPGQTEGLSPEEVTIAEVLSAAGYHTAMWGKWHLGELPEQSPENQGYDYSYYGLFNGAPYAWPDAAAMYADNKSPAGSAMFYDFPGEKTYKEQTGISLTPGFFQGAKGQKRKPVGEVSQPGLVAFEEESAKQILGYIKDKAKADKPFFIYWASYNQQVVGYPPYQNKPHVDKANAQASFMLRHNTHVRNILNTLAEAGIAENTLLVWYSDNGPMYGFWPIAGYTWLRGGKGDITEGGVRVPAMAFWPGMIKPNQDPVDMIHLTDLFTTAARLAGAMDKMPNDRVIDGLDQTSLLLLGEGHGRREYLFYYSGATLGAVRWRNFKMIITGGSHGGLPGMEMYNIVRDPGEKFGAMYPYLFGVTPYQNLIKMHLKQTKKFPNRKPESPEEAQLTQAE